MPTLMPYATSSAAVVLFASLGCASDEVAAPAGWLGFADAVAYPAGGTTLTGLVASDANDDGHLDLITVTRDNLVICILPGTGTGTFDAAATFAAGSDPRRAATGDVNGDGVPDLVAIGHFDNGFTVRLGTGAGQFATGTPYALRHHGRLVAIGDLNGDAYADVVATHDGSGQPIAIDAFVGSASGVLQRSWNVETDLVTSRDIALGDFDDDGHTDLAVGVGDARVALLVFRGLGTGAFEGPTDYPPLPTPIPGSSDGLENLDVADLNGDGRDDIVAAHHDLIEVVTVRLSTGDGLGEPSQIPAASAIDVALGNVDGDDIFDIVVVHRDAGAISVRRGTGDGVFGEPMFIPVGPSPISVVLADLDADGRLDVAVTDLADHKVRVLLNRGP